MSKILDAMRKASFEVGDLISRLAAQDGVNLYPPPTGRQAIEFEQLADSLINKHPGAGGQVVVFAATVSGEGSSYVSYNVAQHLSLMLDRKVAWVDANFRSPQQKLEDDEVNFRSLLRNPDLLDRLDTRSSLVLVANGDAPIKTTNLLSSDAYLRLLARFKEKFFFTVIDAPPILESVDVGHLAQPTDGLVIVVESRRLKHEVIRHGMSQVRDKNVDVVGTVLNKRTFDIPRFLYRWL